MRRVLVAAAVVAAVVVGTALLFALSRTGEAQRPATPREASVRATLRADIQPRTHRFGETVRAQLELVVPAGQIQPETLRASGSFDPYQVVGAPVREIVDVGSFTVARYTIRLRCLKEECLPDEGTKEFSFPPAGFIWKVPAPPGRRFQDRRLDERRAAGAWPPISVARGISTDDLNESRWRSSLRALPEPDTSISPRRLEALLLGAAAVLVAAAAALIAIWARRELRRREDARVVAETPPAALEQALRLIETVDGDAARRRLALETLAVELRGVDQPVLAGDAERLAWAEDVPGREAVALLARAVRERVDGGAS